jgi:LmbE family N-acetylglucosaminyl deacetylase
MSGYSPRSWLLRRYRRTLERLRVAPDQAFLGQSALVFAPHEDDETLGCGGTIIKKTAAGASVRLVFMTDGRRSHSHLMDSERLAAMRRCEAIAAGQRLGLEPSNIHFLGMPDGMLHLWRAAATEQVLDLINAHQPEQIFIPYRREPPSDHVVTNQVVLTALRHHPRHVTIYEYPVWFWYQWPWIKLPQETWRASCSVFKHTVLNGLGLHLLRDFKYAVQISDVLDRKRGALEQHRSQMVRLLPDPNWLTLHDVADGEFLACFFGDLEIFCRYGKRIGR